jgi:hypothetical protein
MTSAIVKRHHVTLESLPTLKAKHDNSSFGEDFMEIFSPPRLAPLFREKGKVANLSIDILLGWDLSKPCIQNFVLGQVMKRKPKMVMLSPPCTTFSCTQNLNCGKMNEEHWAAKQKEGSVLLKFAVEVAEVQIGDGRYFALEHPRSAKSWQDPIIQKLLKKPDIVRANFDQCMFGAATSVQQSPIRKATSIATNSKSVFEAFDGKMCDGQHLHQRALGSEGGKARAAAAAVYPQRMCAVLVEAMMQEMSESP